MADRVISEIGAHTGEPMAVKPKKVTRRQVIGVIGGGLAAGLIGSRLLISNPESHPQEPEPQLKDQPKALYKGLIEILSSVNLRSDHTTESPIIPWENLLEVYGVNVEGENGFRIENTLIVDGQNADTLGRIGGDWVALKAKYKNVFGQIVHDYLFVSKSQKTAEVVKPDYGVGKELKITRVENGSYVLEDGKPFTEKIGKVTLLKKAA